MPRWAPRPPIRAGHREKSQKARVLVGNSEIEVAISCEDAGSFSFWTFGLQTCCFFDAGLRQSKKNKAVGSE